jgi:hypothetical protein
MIAIEKLIRINRDPNFFLKSMRDFPGKIAISVIGFDALGGSASLCLRRVGIPALR